MSDDVTDDVRVFWMTVALGLKDELVVRGNRIDALEQENAELRAQLAEARKWIPPTDYESGGMAYDADAALTQAKEPL